MVACVTQCLAGSYDLRIDMEDFEGKQRHAEYKNFRVDDEKVTLQTENEKHAKSS